MRKELIRAFIFFIVLSLIFFYPILKGQIPFPGDLLVSTYEPYRSYPIAGFAPGGVPTKFQGPDVIRQIIPWKYFAIGQIKKGELPFWDPYNFSGSQLLGNFQSAIFYPFNVLFLLMPFLFAWTIYILFIPILSGFFMYLFLRELKLEKLSSIFGGMVFAFSSYMAVWMEYGNIGHTLLWLPLALLFTERFIQNSKYKNIIFLIFTFFLSMIAGYIQVYFYIVSIAFIYFIVKSYIQKSLSSKSFLLYILSLTVPFLFSFFEFLPAFDLFGNSSRGNYTLSQIQHLLNPWWYSITAIVPNFFGHPASKNSWFYGTYIERVSYIGIIPFIFFLYAFLNFKKRIEIKIFGVIALVSFILSVDLFFTKYFFRIPFPPISTIVPTRILSVFEFGGAVLSAFGFEFFLKRLNKKLLNISIIFVLVVLLICWIVSLFGSKLFNIDPIGLGVAKKNLIGPTFLLLSFTFVYYLWFERRLKGVIILIILITVLDLFYFFQRITPFSSAGFFYPETPVISYLQKNAGINRFWGYGSGYVESNFQTLDITFSPEGYDPLHVKWYTKILQSSKDGSFHTDLPRPDANIAPGYGKEDLRTNKYRQILLNLLGVKYVLNKSNSDKQDDAFDPNIYKLIWHDGTYQIYENKEVFPRAFLASSYIVDQASPGVISKIYDPKFDLRKTVILEEDPKLKLGNDDNSTVQIKNYSPNQIVLESSSKVNKLLFLSDTYFSSWEVRVDGKFGKIYRADYAFRAVPISAGKHKIVFNYGAHNFKRGLSVAVLSLIVFIISSVYLLKRNYVRL